VNELLDYVFSPLREGVISLCVPKTLSVLMT
jgi:hypothetical protein